MTTDSRTFEARLLILEQKAVEFGLSVSVPGTQLQRTLLPDKGVGWVLAIGGMSHPKLFYCGKTVISVLEQAERDFLDRQFNHP